MFSHQKTTIDMALKATELRIGNYVSAPLGEIMQVTQLGTSEKPDYVFASSKHGFGQNGFEPIPLTPELLEKACGFEAASPKGNEYRKDDMTIYFQSNIGIEVILDDWHHGVWVKHLHQLQNLWFALTQIELPIKL